MKLSHSSALCLALSLTVVSAHSHISPYSERIKRDDGFQAAQLKLQGDLENAKDNPKLAQQIQLEALENTKQKQGSMAPAPSLRARDDGFQAAQVKLQGDLERAKDDPELAQQIQLKALENTKQKQDSMAPPPTLRVRDDGFQAAQLKLQSDLEEAKDDPERAHQIQVKALENTKQKQDSMASQANLRVRDDGFQAAQLKLQSDLEKAKDDPGRAHQIQLEALENTKQKQDSMAPSAKFRLLRREAPAAPTTPENEPAEKAPEQTEAEKQVAQMVKDQQAATDKANADNKAAQDKAMVENPGGGVREMTVAEGRVYVKGQYDSAEGRPKSYTINGDTGMTENWR
ncbi:Hypothetical protein D9617_4g004570 [Elsinoe fawcettii]|nr:Hypothetical protein D9617_4g004570 [Elsinoe fawcettii]